MQSDPVLDLGFDLGPCVATIQHCCLERIFIVTRNVVVTRSEGNDAAGLHSGSRAQPRQVLGKYGFEFVGLRRAGGIHGVVFRVTERSHI